MDIETTAYVDGMASVLSSAGIPAAMAVKAASASALEKKAALFNFGDSQDSGSDMGRFLVPLLAASLAGYVGYNAGKEWVPGKSAFDNITGYLGRLGRKLVRKAPRPMYDMKKYMEEIHA